MPQDVPKPIPAPRNQQCRREIPLGLGEFGSAQREAAPLLRGLTERGLWSLGEGGQKGQRGSNRASLLS